MKKVALKLLLLAVLLTGCGSHSEKEVKIYTKPEDAFDNYFENYLSNENYDDIWNDIISKKSKNIDGCKKVFDTNFSQMTLFKYKKYHLNSVEQIKDDIYGINASITVEKDGKTDVQTSDYYFIKESKGYYMLYGGITSIDNYLENSENQNNEFTTENLKIVNTISDITCTFDFVNNSGKTIYFGAWGSMPNLNLYTNEGEYSNQYIDSEFMLPNNSKKSFSVTFSDAKGEPTKIEFPVITYVEADGLPNIMGNSTTSYTINLN